MSPRAILLLALAPACAVAACSLNPQPLPPGEQGADSGAQHGGGDNTGSMGDGGAALGSDAGSREDTGVPAPGDSGATAMPDGAGPSDAGSDVVPPLTDGGGDADGEGGPEDAGPDAVEAGDALTE